MVSQLSLEKVQLKAHSKHRAGVGISTSHVLLSCSIFLSSKRDWIPVRSKNSTSGAVSYLSEILPLLFLWLALNKCWVTGQETICGLLTRSTGQEQNKTAPSLRNFPGPTSKVVTQAHTQACTHTQTTFSQICRSSMEICRYMKKGNFGGWGCGLSALAYLTCPQPCFLISTTENRQSSFDVKILKFPLPAAVLGRATLPLSWAAQLDWLVAQVQESRQADQLSYDPVPDQGLWVGPL